MTEVVAYRTVVADPEREGEPDIYRMLLERRIDVVTFTSALGGAQLREGARRRAGGGSAADDHRARRSGRSRLKPRPSVSIQTTIMPAQYTVPALVDAIVESFRAGQNHVMSQVRLMVNG